MPAPSGPTIGAMSTTPTTATTAPTSTALPLRTGRWAVDHAHSALGFTIRHLGIAKVRGRFSGFDAEVTVGETPETCTVTVTVDLASVDTGNPDRDAHIRAADMIDVEQRPTMTFRSTGLRLADGGDGDRGHLDGELTIGDVTRPLTLALEYGGLGDHPKGGPRRAGFEATGEIRRSDYGISPQFPNAALGDVVRIALDLELLEPDEA
jgi:polyisoprenoid-binding protein YceI